MPYHIRINFIKLLRYPRVTFSVSCVTRLNSCSQAAVLAMDESVLDVDQVENLIKFCPTKEEMELLKVKLNKFMRNC